jgi:CheY-like chemotaxis protein
VHEAPSGEEALVWVHESGITPALLITDVVMPGMSGPALAGRLLKERPDLRVLYVSGYAEDASALDGAFLDRIPLLQKPFTPSKLAQRIRTILDTRG